MYAYIRVHRVVRGNLNFFQCDDIDNNDDWHRCEDGLAIELGDCFDTCFGDSSCIIDCGKQYENSIKDCPCMEGCPDGCPCDNWDCDATTTTTETTSTTATTTTATTTTTSTSTTTTSTTTKPVPSEVGENMVGIYLVKSGLEI